MSRARLPAFPKFTINVGGVVSDAASNVLPRYVLLESENSMLQVDDYSLDDESVEWTPLEDSGYEVNQSRECRMVETGEPGHLWVLIGKSFHCVYALSSGVFGTEHRGPCGTGLTTCKCCGAPWKMYEQHHGKCWPCIQQERLVGLVIKCSRPRSFCTESRTCLNCVQRTFYNHERSLFWHSSNPDEPWDLAMKSGLQRVIICPKCDHGLTLRLYSAAYKPEACGYCNNRFRCERSDCEQCFKGSFASHPRSSEWHPTLNGNVTPRQVSLNDNYKYWFSCRDCKHDILKALNNVAGGGWCSYCANQAICDNEDCKYCFDNSFASHPRSKHWHPIKNRGILPRNIAKCTDTKYWFYCHGCKHDVALRISDVSNGQWCGYCTNRYRCSMDSCQYCFDNSFASHPCSKYWHPTKNNCTPRQVAISARDSYWFACPDCRHDISLPLHNVAAGQWCGYCNGRERCMLAECEFCYYKSFASYARSKYWHPTKNGSIGSRQVARNDNDRYWFICPYCRSDFAMKLNHVSKGHWCPCRKNKTEAKLLEWLLSVLPSLTVIHGASFNWCRNPNTAKYLPFDFFIEALNIIIELDGRQHWEQVADWQAPEENQRRDLFKMEKAFAQRLTIIRLCQEDVFHDRYDWRTTLYSHLTLCVDPVRILLDNNTGLYKRIKYEL
jgi:very-short-patch-repair endonuclease